MEPTFISSVAPQTSRKQLAVKSTEEKAPPSKVEGSSSGSFITGIIGNMFGGGKEQIQPPADKQTTHTLNDKPTDEEGSPQEDVQPYGQEPEIHSHSPIPIPQQPLLLPQQPDKIESSSPQTSLLQRMSQAGDQVFGKSIEECDGGNGAQELEDELVVRVTKGTSRQRRSHRTKKKKKKHKTEDKGQPDDVASVVSNESRTISEGVVLQQEGVVLQQEGVVSTTQQTLARTDSVNRLRSNAVSFVPDMHTEEVVDLSAAVEDNRLLQDSSPGDRDVASDPGESSLLNEFNPTPADVSDDQSPPDLGVGGINDLDVGGVSPDLPVNTELLSEAIDEPYEPHLNTNDQVDGSGESPLINPFGDEDPDGGDSSASASPEVQLKQNESETSSTDKSPEVKGHQKRGQSDSDFEMLTPEEFNEEGAPHKTREVWIPSPVEPVVYEGSPSRPLKITENDKMAADVRIDENTRLVFSLDILYEDDEQTRRVSGVSILTRVSNIASYLGSNNGNGRIAFHSFYLSLLPPTLVLILMYCTLVSRSSFKLPRPLV